MSGQRYYGTVFALAGDVAPVPDPAQGDGTVSYTEGYGFDYERDPATDPAAKRISRDQMNELFKDITANVREYQIAGFPEWVTPAQNGGVAVPYPKNAYVRYDTVGDGSGWAVFASLINANTAEPNTDPTKWIETEPLSVPALVANQAQVDTGDDDTKLVGPVELVRAAREGRWAFAGPVVYATGQNLTAVLPGAGVYDQTAGASISFTVPGPNLVGVLTLKVGPNARVPLRSATGDELQANDLVAAGLYTAKFTGAEWRLDTPIPSELRQYGSKGSGALYGLILSNAGGALTTAVNIAVGDARDSTNAANITLVAPTTKRLDQPWVAGSGNGGRDSGGVGPNQTWHTFVIMNPITGAVDGLFSQSANAPVLPPGYTLFRRVGSILTDGASLIRQFVQHGDFFELVPRSSDYAAQANGGGPFLRKITVPNGIRVKAQLYFQSTGTADANPYLSGIFDPAEGVPTPFGGPTQWAQIRRLTRYTYPGAWISYETVVCEQWTDTAQNIYTYSSDPLDSIAIGVLGWTDQRGQFF